MGLFRKRLDNWDIAKKIMSHFSEELKVLRTCDEYHLELALFDEFYSEPVKFKFIFFKAAIPSLKKLLKDINIISEPPLGKKYVQFHCMCIKHTIFYVY